MPEIQPKPVLKASFNPIVKAYIVIYVAFFLLISVIGIPLMIIWLVGVGQWYARHYFAKLECEVTEENLRFRKGIIFQVEKTIPLENIQDLTFIEGPLLHYFNLCILKVETAGKGDYNGNEMKLIGIIDAPAFRAEVLRQRQIIKTRQNRDNGALMQSIHDSLLRIEELIKMNK